MNTIFLPRIWEMDSRRIGIKGLELDKFLNFILKQLLLSGNGFEIQSNWNMRQQFVRRCSDLFNQNKNRS